MRVAETSGLIDVDSGWFCISHLFAFETFWLLSSVTSPKTYVDRSCTLSSPCCDPFGLPARGVFLLRPAMAQLSIPHCFFDIRWSRRGLTGTGKVDLHWVCFCSVHSALFCKRLCFISSLVCWRGSFSCLMKTTLLQLSRPCFIRCIFMS